MVSTFVDLTERVNFPPGATRLVFSGTGTLNGLSSYAREFVGSKAE